MTRNRPRVRRVGQKRKVRFKRTLTDGRWFSEPGAFYRDALRRGAVVATAATIPHLNSHIRGIATKLDTSNVLEIGCGSRPISAEMAPSKLTLVDLLPEHMKTAREFIESASQMRPRELVDPSQVTFLTADARNQIPQLEGKHFSLTVLAEVLTHIQPGQRLVFLNEWARKTDAFLIVDRQAGLKGEIKKRPELMNGREIKDAVSRMGFKAVHFDTRSVDVSPSSGQTQHFDFFFIAAKRK